MTVEFIGGPWDGAKKTVLSFIPKITVTFKRIASTKKKSIRVAEYKIVGNKAIFVREK